MNGETDGAGHWFITEEGWDCKTIPGQSPLVTGQQLCSRYYDDLARAMKWRETREQALRAELSKLGLSHVRDVSEFVELVGVSCFDLEEKPTLVMGVRGAMEHNLEMESAWDPDIIRSVAFSWRDVFNAAQSIDLCPDLELATATLQCLDVHRVIENLRHVTTDFTYRAKNDDSEFGRYAGRLARLADSALVRACDIIDDRRPLSIEGSLSDRQELRSTLWWHARLCTVIAAGVILLDPPTTRDTARLSAYRSLYVGLSVLHERAQGTMSPWEGIRIAKERL